MPNNRLAEELKAVGLPCRGLRNGAPTWTRPLSPDERSIADTVQARHIEDDTSYLDTDLHAHGSELKFVLGEESPQWTAYRDLQKKVQAEVAGLPEWALRLLDALADGKDLGAIQTEARSLRERLKRN